MSALPKWLLIHSDTKYKDPAGFESQIVLSVLILPGTIIYNPPLNCEVAQTAVYFFPYSAGCQL